MKKVSTAAIFHDLLLQEKAIVYFFEDWSTYSNKLGLEEIKAAENKFLNSTIDFVFWCVDSSSLATSDFIIPWLKDNTTEQIDFKVICGVGNGAILWLKKGKIIDFAYSAFHLKTAGIVKKTIKNFSIENFKLNE